jgi:hypothetical protein
VVAELDYRNSIVSCNQAMYPELAMCSHSFAETTLSERWGNRYRSARTSAVTLDSIQHSYNCQAQAMLLHADGSLHFLHRLLFTFVIVLWTTAMVFVKHVDDGMYHI